MRNTSLVVMVVVAFLAVANSVLSSRGGMRKLVGEDEEKPTGLSNVVNIPDVHDPNIVAIAMFGLVEHTKETEGEEAFVFEDILSGETLDVADGTIYFLIIQVEPPHLAASNDGPAYEADVLVGKDGSMKLIRFVKR